MLDLKIALALEQERALRSELSSMGLASKAAPQLVLCTSAPTHHRTASTAPAQGGVSVEDGVPLPSAEAYQGRRLQSTVRALQGCDTGEQPAWLAVRASEAAAL